MSTIPRESGMRVWYFCAGTVRERFGQAGPNEHPGEVDAVVTKNGSRSRQLLSRVKLSSALPTEGSRMSRCERHAD